MLSTQVILPFALLTSAVSVVAAAAAAASTTTSSAAAASSSPPACAPRPPVDPGYGVPAFYGFPPHPPFQCGQTDVYFTGLPPNHPTVISQGYPPDFVASALAEDKANILKAGYNLKTVLQGPEQPISNTANGLYSQPLGVVYDAAIIGFGVRGASYVNLTAQLENEISLFRQRLPQAPLGFNISPYSTLAALKRVAPIQGNCSKIPGKDYGTYIYCSSSVCTVPYSPQIGTTYS